MQIYPAIDIKGGRVVRVLEGERRRETAYADDPLAQAHTFVAEGARWLHVVDMDRAFGTGGDNTEWVRQISALEPVRVQVGGNICTMEWVKVATAVGASRIILGTEAACDEVVLARLVREVGPERCGLAVDVRDGRVVLRTARAGRVPAVVDLANRALDCGVRTIVYRDMGRDGLVVGADVPGAARVADLGAEVIVAGGVAGLDDIRAAAAADLAGVVVGRALYEGRFTLSEALECSQ